MEQTKKALEIVKSVVNNIEYYEDKKNEYIVCRVRAEIDKIQEIYTSIFNATNESNELDKYFNIEFFSYINGFVYFILTDEYSPVYDFLDLKVNLVVCGIFNKNIYYSEQLESDKTIFKK
jgi:hypothetical protein